MNENGVVCLPGPALLFFILRFEYTISGPKSYRHFRETGPRGLVLYIPIPEEQVQRNTVTFLLPVLRLQPQNHILKGNRATAIDPWCVWLQTSQPDRLLNFPWKTADPDTLGKLGLAHFVLAIQTGDHCWFFYWKAKKQIKRKKVKFEMDVS